MGHEAPQPGMGVFLVQVFRWVVLVVLVMMAMHQCSMLNAHDAW